MRAACPKRFAARIANAKRHQRAAAVEVDADPVPADGAARQVTARPLVIEPCTARHAARACTRFDGAFDAQFPGYRNFAAGLSPTGPDPANRVGEITSRLDVINHLFYDHFLRAPLDQ